jgi:hypothetical protein
MPRELTKEEELAVAVLISEEEAKDSGLESSVP